MNTGYMELPDNVYIVLRLLKDAGYSAYVVGGCCRDFILGKKPNDYDVATSATPEQMIEVFDGLRTIPTGIQHGTITVVIGSDSIECTTYRLDGEYLDYRTPDKVVFLNSIEDDLMRRDFTVNAIAYNPWKGFVDPMGGIKDVGNSVIRCVGKAENRFNEDALRILRAMRFAAQLGFKIEEETSRAIHNQKHLLDKISKERIQSELCKILMSRFGGNKVLDEYSDVLCQIIPDIKPMIDFDPKDRWNCYDVWKHTMKSMDRLYINNEKDADIITRLALLFHDIGKPHCEVKHDERGFRTYEDNPQISAKMTYKILRDLKFSNEIVGYVTQLISYRCVSFEDYIPMVDLKKLLNKIGEKQLFRLLFLEECNARYGMILQCTQNRRSCAIDAAHYDANSIIEYCQCYSLKQLAINGDDLIELGVPQGKEVGALLEKLLDMVIEGNVNNNKNELIEMAEEIINV